jgi:hypothetical protein
MKQMKDFYVLKRESLHRTGQNGKSDEVVGYKRDLSLLSSGM